MTDMGEPNPLWLVLTQAGGPEWYKEKKKKKQLSKP